MNNLTIKDLTDSALFAIRRDGSLNKKQIDILCRKALDSDSVDKRFFWSDYVSKHGIPKHGDNAFGRGIDYYIHYYFKNLNHTI